MTFSVEGWTVSPRKSRRKSACFSSTMDLTPAARQQEAQHHAGRPATHDAALGGERRHSSISRNTRPVAVMASSAGTPSGPLTHSFVVGV